MFDVIDMDMVQITDRSEFIDRAELNDFLIVATCETETRTKTCRDLSSISMVGLTEGNV